MTAKELIPLIEGQYINIMRSNTVKVVLEDGSFSKGQFIQLLQEDEDIRANKWLFSSKGIEILLHGDDIKSVTLLIKQCDNSNGQFHNLFWLN